MISFFFCLKGIFEENFLINFVFFEVILKSLYMGIVMFECVKSKWLVVKILLFILLKYIFLGFCIILWRLGRSFLFNIWYLEFLIKLYSLIIEGRLFIFFFLIILMLFKMLMIIFCFILLWILIYLRKFW